jgi:hypothetical protein
MSVNTVGSILLTLIKLAAAQLHAAHQKTIEGGARGWGRGGRAARSMSLYNDMNAHRSNRLGKPGPARRLPEHLPGGVFSVSTAGRAQPLVWLWGPHGSIKLAPVSETLIMVE